MSILSQINLIRQKQKSINNINYCKQNLKVYYLGNSYEIYKQNYISYNTRHIKKLLVPMIEVKNPVIQRQITKIIDSQQITIKISDPPNSTMSISITDYKSGNKYGQYYTYDNLNENIRSLFQNLHELYHKIYIQIKRDGGRVNIEENGILRFEYLDESNQRDPLQHILILKTKLKEWKTTTNLDQAIELIFQKLSNMESKDRQNEHNLAKKQKIIKQIQTQLNQSMESIRLKIDFQIQKSIQENSNRIKQASLQIANIKSINEQREKLFKAQIKEIEAIKFANQQRENLFKNQIKEIETIKQKLQLTFLMTDVFSNPLKQKNLNLSNKNIIQLPGNIGRQAEQITVMSDRKTPAINNINAIKLLSRLEKVQKLEIGWCQGMSSDITMEILDRMPQLKQLTLLGCSLDANSINKLCEFQQLRQFHFSRDSNPKYLQKFQEDWCFIGIKQLKQSQVPSINQTIGISKLSQLINIQIAHPNQEQSAKILRNMGSLKHLTLGYNFIRKYNIHTELFKEIEKLSELISLCLVGLQFNGKQQYIRSVIRNNKNLDTFVIRNNNGFINDKHNTNISDSTIEQLSKKGLHLQNLIIQGQYSITGIHLSKFQHLKILSLKDCRGVKKEFIKQGLSKMSQLTHLILSYNGIFDWVDDELMGTIGAACKSITMIDISFTKVKGKGLLKLKGLQKLSVLVCGSTEINGRDLVEFTKNIHTIRKLSLWSLDVNDSELLEINKNCESGITHLYIKDCRKITVEALLAIKQLKVVRSSLQENQEDRLEQAGIVARKKTL